MIQSRFLGQIPYQEAYRLQRDLWQRRVNGEVPDQLLLLEHPPVITLGRGFQSEHLLVAEERLRELGIKRVETDRGGDITYHGPGQLVGYPILDLKPDRMDVLRYLRDLEEVLIRLLRHFGVCGKRHPGYTGVWVGNRKIASIGVKISRWVTYHGFALNVHCDLSPFDMMIPCGIHRVQMTSMLRESGKTFSLEHVAQIAAEKMNEVFSQEITNREIVPETTSGANRHSAHAAAINLTL